MSRRLLAIGIAILVVGAAAAVTMSALRVEAFTVQNCHDDSSISRNNTHGSPLNGSFGHVSASPNHSDGYYYLEAQAANGCGIGADGKYHFVGRTTANGTGLLSGCTPSSGWGPPCDPSFRAVSGAAMANERPAWGFEYKDAGSGAVLACTGGDGSGGSDCPGTPNMVANPGNSTVEFRYDGSVSAVRFRLDNQYDDPIWETATLDVVPCSTCEPGGNSSPSTPPSSNPTPPSSNPTPPSSLAPTSAPAPSDTPSPTPSNTASPKPSDSDTPSPTPSDSDTPSPEDEPTPSPSTSPTRSPKPTPTPSPVTVPCIVNVQGVLVIGQCPPPH